MLWVLEHRGYARGLRHTPDLGKGATITHERTETRLHILVKRSSAAGSSTSLLEERIFVGKRVHEDSNDDRRNHAYFRDFVFLNRFKVFFHLKAAHNVGCVARFQGRHVGDWGDGCVEDGHDDEAFYFVGVFALGGG